MNGQRLLEVGQFALKVAGSGVGLVFALLDTLGKLFGSAEVEQNQERRLHDSDFVGEYNHRTGRLDAGFDPYGWYDED